MKNIIVFILGLLVATEITANEVIKGSNLFTNPTNSYVQLSPDGKLLSYVETADDGKYIMLFDTVTEEFRTSVKIGARSRLRKHYWINNDSLLIDISRGSSDILLTGNVTEEGVKLKTQKFYGTVINLLPQQPDKILFSLRKKKKRTNLLLVSIEDFLQGDFSDAQETKFGVKRVKGVNFEPVSNRIILSTYDKNKKIARFYWQKPGKKQAHKFVELVDFEDFFQPIHFIDKSRLAVLTNKNSDKIVLQEYFIATQSLGDIIYAHDVYDLTEATYDNEGRLFSVGFYEQGIFQRSFFKKSNSQFAKRLKKTFPGKSIYIVDGSLKNNNMVLKIAGSDEPGTYYLYKKDLDTARILMSRYPQLDDVSLASNEKSRVKVDENTKLEVYLTRPPHHDLSTLLVYPHGGPIGIRETDQYQADVQYLANRGFTVLRINFRGSSGFGKSFENKGIGQFGKLIEEDIMAAVKEVLSENSFEHICAIGSSYGGYSSAMLAIKHPKLFECVVASFGIFDLPLLFNESNVKMHEDRIRSISKVVGEFSEDFREVSPVYLASQLESPILLIAGKTDTMTWSSKIDQPG